MRKLSLSEWASVAEIIGAITIVVSLLFLVHEVNQNTKALQVANVNQIYDRTDSLNSDIAASPELASFYVKEVFGVDGLWGGRGSVRNRDATGAKSMGAILHLES